MKKVAVINDLSGFGKCSLSVTIPILSVMGVQPCAMPTAVLSNQTGFENHYCADLTESMSSYIEMWKKNNESFDGIYSGYVASQKQIDCIFKFINLFKSSHTLLLVDPVMADNGKVYSGYNTVMCQKMCELAKRADIITPNLTELCIIANKEYNELTVQANSQSYLEQIFETAKSVITRNEQKIIVTGIKKDGFIYNGVFSKESEFFTKSNEYGTGFSGTGDIFASIVCASLVNGDSLYNAAQKATDFIEKSITDTIKEPYNSNYGVNFEKFLHELY